MSRLQSCSKCGAQFDVSSFAPGQQFTCGSCGAVLTAGQGAAPAAPAVKGRTPGSRTPAGRTPAGRTPAGRTPAKGTSAKRTPAGRGKAARGPQYQPPKRQQAGQAEAPPKAPPKVARGGRASSRRGEREGGFERPEKKGNPALLYGAGALVIAIVLIVVMVGGGGNDDEGGGTGPLTTAGNNAATGTSGGESAREPDTIATIKADLRETNLRRPAEYHKFADRFLAVGGEDAKTEVGRIYEELLAEVDPDDFKAHKFFGHTDFQSDILGRPLEVGGDPIAEEIANRRGYPYLDAIIQFNQKRWLTDEDDIRLAKEAVKDMRTHVKKLANNHQFRAADRIRANIAQDPLLAPYNYETRWAAPYLICYSSKDRLSEYDLLKIPDFKTRNEKRKEMIEKRKEWTKVLDEKEALYTQLYKEWMREFQKDFELKDLFDEYGGRSDYSAKYRSFADGVPLVIWIFNDRAAFQNYHNEVKGQPIPAFAAGYFVPSTAWVYLFDETNTDSDRVFEINKNLHEGTHQLEHWFTRQKNKWREPYNTQTAFSEGIAEFFGSVEMDRKRKLKWTGVNQTRLRNMQSFAKQFEERGKKYPLFPLERLTWSSKYREITSWAAVEYMNRGVDQGLAMALFYQQSWAYVYFMLTFENGKYKERFMQFFDAVLSRMTGMTAGQDVWKRIFKVRDEVDWEELEEDWQKFVFEDLMKRTVPTYKPPKRDEWD